MAVSNYNAALEMKRSTDRFEGFTLNMVKSSTKDINKLIRRVSLQLLRLILKKTPVDTGRARSAWVFSAIKLGASASVFGEINTLGLADGDFFEKQGQVSIINNVDYIVPLEFGHSGQAPFGMVRISMLEMERGKANLPAIVLNFYRSQFNTASNKLPALRAARVA